MIFPCGPFPLSVPLCPAHPSSHSDVSHSLPLSSFKSFLVALVVPEPPVLRACLVDSGVLDKDSAESEPLDKL